MFHLRNVIGLIRALTRAHLSATKNIRARPTNTTRYTGVQNPLMTLTWLNGVTVRSCSRAHPSRLHHRGTRPTELGSRTPAYKGLRALWQRVMPKGIPRHKSGLPFWIRGGPLTLDIQSRVKFGLASKLSGNMMTCSRQRRRKRSMPSPRGTIRRA